MQAQMLAPAAVLVTWSLLMLLWLAATRFPAMAKVKDRLKDAKPGGRGQDLEGLIPARVNWKAHNYAHLMEQPTVFYPAVVILAMMGASGFDVLLAWIYVALRIVHSVYQSTINNVMVRFTIFALATIPLVILAIRAVMATLFHNPGAI